MKQISKFFSSLNESPFIFPVFIKEGVDGYEPIDSLPGHNFWGVNALSELRSGLSAKNILSLAVYCVPKNRDGDAKEAYLEDGFAAKAITSLRETAPDISIISDLCVCQFTPSAHCMLSGDNGFSDKKTIENISRQAVLHAKCGVDALMPSGMTPGVVQAIRTAIANEGLGDIPVVPQAAKFVSTLYLPFRHAAHAVVEIDKSKYQLPMDAFEEAKLKLQEAVSEGASGVIVKPALFHLDLIRWAAEELSVPVIAFSTSGEYNLVRERDELKSEYFKMLFGAGARGVVSYFEGLESKG